MKAVSGLRKASLHKKACQTPLINDNSYGDCCHQKQADCMQQRLKRLVEPQGQGSLRPSFSMSSFSPCTNRKPFFTCVSDG